VSPRARARARAYQPTSSGPAHLLEQHLVELEEEQDHRAGVSEREPLAQQLSPQREVRAQPQRQHAPLHVDDQAGAIQDPHQHEDQHEAEEAMAPEQRGERQDQDQAALDQQRDGLRAEHLEALQQEAQRGLDHLEHEVDREHQHGRPGRALEEAARRARGTARASAPRAAAGSRAGWRRAAARARDRG
jgi:hypothetical protein